MTPKGLTRIPRYGQSLLLGDLPVICVDIGSNGNFAQSVFVMDAKGRVSEVKKEALTDPRDICCMACHGTGQDDPPPGKYHCICQTCKGTGKKV